MNRSLIVFLFTLAAHGATCTQAYTPKDLYGRILGSEIHLALQELRIAAGDGLITDARKIFNPDLEHFTTTGDQFGQHNVTSESRIWFHLQLNGKRDKKARVLEVDQQMGKVERDRLALGVKREVILGLLRYKQVLQEMRSVKNLQSAVGNFIERYQDVKFLSPEQKVEVGALRISQRDLSLRMAELENEDGLLRRFFQRAMRENCEVTITGVDAGKENAWPDLRQYDYRPDQSVEFQLDRLSLQKSQYVFDREESRKVPDVKLSPVWQSNRLGNNEYNLFGASIILPLPFTDRNQGLRDSARVDVRRSELELDFKRIQRQKEFAFRKESYTRLRSKLDGDGGLGLYTDNLESYAGMFRRGLISISSFLSYKRELLLLMVEVHQVEATLTEHMVELYHLNADSSDAFLAGVLRL